MREHQRLPHLRPFAIQPIVYLTVVTHERRAALACSAVHAILRDIWSRSPTLDGWSVGRFMMMPDHVHLFARAARDAKPLARWVQAWKSLSSRRLTTELNAPPPLWQKDYFDRFLRSGENYHEKWDYVMANPVRKGLVRTPEEWPWQGVLVDLTF
jgi:putative transposase